MAALATAARITAARTTPARLAAAVQSRQVRHGTDAGMTTAEYAVGTVAACGFAGVLFKVITSPLVLDLVKSVITRAFRLSF
jgi:hypothetical protein